MDGEQSPIPTREELIQLARELAPTLEERSENAAALRRIPGKTIEDFHRLGFFKVVQPKRFGGYEIIDNWHVSGLRGSGSKDVAVDGAFVPDHRMHKFADGFRQKSPGHELNSSPIDRRVHFRHDSARAARVSTEIVSQLFIACGARAAFEDHPLNRHFQDVYAIRLHHANSPDTPASNMGGVLFGKNNTDFFI
jgi:alkylation response protein AidB-like acyl-CoA dehydrogenase